MQYVPPSINCDMGESFGLYRMGDDAAIMPYITVANLACGFHAGDPVVMARTVALATQHRLKIGAHPSLPDLQGFGRREMRMAPEEIVAGIIYQVGALKGFLAQARVPLNHIKPHGALYGMAARMRDVAEAVVEAAAVFDVPVFGIAGTAQEAACERRNIGFVGEFYADLDYDDDGGLIISREHRAVDPGIAADRVAKALFDGRTKSINGRDLAVSASSVCVHSDTPNAVAIAKAVHDLLASYLDGGR
jgi:UPF0271 protein